MIFSSSDRLEINRHLDAVDELQQSLASASLSPALQIAMARLEDEFRSILLSRTSPIPTDSFSESTHPELYDAEEEEDEDEGGGEKRFSHQESTASCCYKSAASSIREVDLIPGAAAYDLRCITARMNAAGYLRECVQVYTSVRKSAVDAGLRRLGVEKLSIGNTRLPNNLNI